MLLYAKIRSENTRGRINFMMLSTSVVLGAIILALRVQRSALILVRPSYDEREKTLVSRWGDQSALWDGPPPYFLETPRPVNVTAQLGQKIDLHCRVNNLGDKTVSWVRRHGNSFELLTFGHLTYSSDDRYSLAYVEPYDWILVIKNVQSKDSGAYECQISLHPPLSKCTYLKVLIPVVEIVDSSGSSVAERFYRLGTTIELTCVGIAPAFSRFGDSSEGNRMIWMFDGRALNQDTTRGGISVKTEVTDSGLISQLHIAGARRSDAGSYECFLSDSRASAVVHVLSGEHADAMQYGGARTHYEVNRYLQILCFYVAVYSVINNDVWSILLQFDLMR